MKVFWGWMIGLTAFVAASMLIYRFALRPKVEELSAELASDFDYEDVWEKLPA